MRKILLLTAIILYAGCCIAQDTKKVTTETQIPYSKEVYSVLKTDKKRRHGEYLKYNRNNQVLEKGQYEQGEKAGVWEFYNWNGELEQKFNYSENKIDWAATADFKSTIQTEVNGVFIDEKPEQLPVFIGGDYRFKRFTFAVLYPVEARRNNTQGTVLLSFVVTADGKMIDEKVEHGIGSGCDEAALEAFKKIPDEWIPAVYKGEKKNVKIYFPFKFKLE